MGTRERMGTREQQKARRRQDVLRAAEHLFAQDGIQKTTVDAIAARAGLAWATVYKYYGSKDAIVDAVVRPELERIFSLADQIIANPPHEARDAVFALVGCYTRWRDNWQDRRLLRAMSSAGAIKDAGAVHELSVWANTRLRAQIRDLLELLQQRGCVARSANLDDMSQVIYAVFNQEYEVYIRSDDMPAGQVFARIRRLINTLFEPWTSENGR